MKNISWLAVAVFGGGVVACAYGLGWLHGRGSGSGFGSGRGAVVGGGEPASFGLMQARGSGGRGVANVAQAGVVDPVAEARRRLADRGFEADAVVAALLEASQTSDPVEADLLFAEVLRGLTRGNAQAAVETLMALPRDRSLRQTVRNFCYAWGQIDGEGAAAFAAGLEGRDGDNVRGFVVAGWATADPDAAESWVAGYEGDGAAEAKEGLVYGLAKVDAARATRYVLEWDEEWAIDLVGTEVLRQGVPAAKEWVESLPPGEIKGEALMGIASEIGESDFEGTVAWIRGYAAEPFAAEAVAAAAEELADRDPADALGWVEDLAAGEGRSRAFFEAMAGLTDQDALAASEYLKAMPAGQDRDYAVSAFVRHHADEDAEASLAWAETITDRKMRAEALVDAGRELVRRDPAAAAAWFESSDLPVDLQEQIASAADRREYR